MWETKLVYWMLVLELVRVLPWGPLPAALALLDLCTHTQGPSSPKSGSIPPSLSLRHREKQPPLSPRSLGPGLCLTFPKDPEERVSLQVTLPPQ